MGDYIPPLRMQPEQYPTYPCRFCGKDSSAYWHAHEELLHCTNCDTWLDNNRRWTENELARLRTLKDRYFESLPKLPLACPTHTGSMTGPPESKETTVITRAIKRLREEG